MKGVYHILNGDALLSLFPTNIIGEKHVARECLVDGSLEGDSLDSFYENRANFLEIDYEDYYKKTVSQFQKIQNFPSGSEINLWFEDDLFCQVNMWFVIDLLVKSYRDFDIYLIRPDKHTQYGFGYYDAQGLENLYTKKNTATDYRFVFYTLEKL